MRRAFTLIELLAVVAIAGIMVTLAAVSLSRGQGAARIKGATRDIFASIRRARSTALVTQQPCVITYSTRTVDGEVSAKVEITTAKMMSSTAVKDAWTLSGEKVSLVDDEPAPDPDSPDASPDDASAGETIEEILFSPISEDVVKGIAIKVAVGDEALAETLGEEKEKSKLSVFSNVDYLIGKFQKARSDAAAKAAEENPDAAASPAETEEQEPVSVVWEVNGRCEPHRVWVYPSGGRPEDGLSIRIDKFGAAKVLADGEDE